MKALWIVTDRDPRNMLGQSVIHGRDSLYRTRLIQAARVGNSIKPCVILGQHIPALGVA